MQLPGNGAYPPLLSVVVAQDLSFDIRHNHHGRVLLARDAAALGDATGDAETRDEPDPGIADRTSDSASPFAGAVHPRKPRRSPSPASPATQDHPTAVGVNPDASLYCSAPDSWVFHHGDSAVFVADPYRTKAVVETFLGPWRPDYWTSDRLGSQTGWAKREHQFCLAHLIRDTQYVIDEGDAVFAPGLKGLLKRACAIGCEVALKSDPFV